VREVSGGEHDVTASLPCRVARISGSFELDQKLYRGVICESIGVYNMLSSSNDPILDLCVSHCANSLHNFRLTFCSLDNDTPVSRHKNQSGLSDFKDSELKIGRLVC